jgi:hypothetical protein
MDELFRLLGNIKTIERIDKVAWAAEVRILQIGEEKQQYLVSQPTWKTDLFSLS